MGLLFNCKVTKGTHLKEALNESIKLCKDAGVSLILEFNKQTIYVDRWSDSVKIIQDYNDKIGIQKE